MAKIVPAPPTSDPSDTPHERMWGFADSGFEVREGAIVMRSSRYAQAGVPLPHLAPFVKNAVGVPFDAEATHPLAAAECPAARPCPGVLAALERLVASSVALEFSTEDRVRLRHGHGHHLEEIFKLLFLKLERVPDVVVFPKDEAALQALVALAQEEKALLVPFGGGTCVSMALSAKMEDERPLISVDMSRMNRIVEVDPDNLTATIQAGAVGIQIQEGLAELGYTMGHEPDSLEFSTLGGWIATHASGMKKNRYGNIEDQVLDLRMITSDGVVEHPVAAPRVSHGIDARKLALGSEGRLGIISQAVVKIHPLPEVQNYGSLVFPDWQRGLAFMKALSQLQAMPASVRLVDNLQFQFGRALKPEGSKWKSRLQKLYVEKLKGIDTSQMVACTLVYEGQKQEQQQLERRVLQLASRFGGFPGGASAGKDGYNLTFGIAYIRDFLLQYWVLGDSFETSVPWTQVDEVIAGVKKAIASKHQELGLPGHTFVTARISQPYTSGCCIYFYIGFNYKNVSDPLAAFIEIEHVAREAILRGGGSLSHHHGVGKLRAPYLPQVKSAAALSAVERVTSAWDVEGIFTNGNQNPAPRAH